MNVSEIITAFGAYYKREGQGTQKIYQQLIQGFVSHTAFTHIQTDETIWRGSEASHGVVVQPFQKAFTPQGTSEFKPAEIRMFHLKADLADYPDDIEASWLGFLSSNDVKRTDWPFVKYWIEKLVVPRINQDIELNEIGRGVYSAPTPSVAGAPGTAMDGILTVIQDHIDEGNITPIALGAVPEDPAEFVEYLEEFHAALPILYRNVPMNVYGPEDFVLRYKRGFRAKYGTNYGFSNDDFHNSSVKILDSNLTLVGLPSLNLNSEGDPNDRFFCTQKQNAILLTKRLGHKDGTFDVQGFDRQVKLLTDWWMGVGFIIPQVVFVNDGAASEEGGGTGGGEGGGGEGGGSTE